MRAPVPLGNMTRSQYVLAMIFQVALAWLAQLSRSGLGVLWMNTTSFGLSKGPGGVVSGGLDNMPSTDNGRG